MEHGFNKPWTAAWLYSLRGLPPIDQVIGMWVGHLAEKDGSLSGYNWASLSEFVGLKPDTIRKQMRRSPLLTKGYMERIERKVGNVQAVPLLRIRLDNIKR